MEEDELDTDLTLHAVDPDDVTGPKGTIARDDDEPDSAGSRRAPLAPTIAAGGVVQLRAC